MAGKGRLITNTYTYTHIHKHTPTEEERETSEFLDAGIKCDV